VIIAVEGRSEQAGLHTCIEPCVCCHFSQSPWFKAGMSCGHLSFRDVTKPVHRRAAATAAAAAAYPRGDKRRRSRQQPGHRRHRRLRRFIAVSPHSDKSDRAGTHLLHVPQVEVWEYSAEKETTRRLKSIAAHDQACRTMVGTRKYCPPRHFERSLLELIGAL
jgi:hypothetical protein